MAGTIVEALILDVLEWVTKRDRTYEEVMGLGAHHAPDCPCGKKRMIAVSSSGRT